MLHNKIMNIELAHIESIYTHYVGNSSQEEQLNISKQPLNISSEELRQLIQKYFIHPFKDKAYYQFTHTNDIQLNEVYSFAKQIFQDPSSLYLNSIQIAKFLFSQSSHPNIKGGELYVVYFDDVVVDGETTDAIGLFKSESKETYLKITPISDGFSIESEQGIDIKKLDKGCIIFNLQSEEGFKLGIVDQTNKQQEAVYWKDDFLQVTQKTDSFQYTENYMQLCKEFVTEKLPELYEVNRTEQIDLLNKSVQYFKKQEQFSVQAFTDTVIEQDDMKENFKSFTKEYQSRYNVPLVDEFDISPIAVKKKQQVFKSVLKLDRNFHVYIHGNKEYIERGFDDVMGMNFYKIYFKEEQ
ncbi:MAG: nucleoid-associated protein [Cytophagaceae bacterium]